MPPDLRRAFEEAERVVNGRFLGVARFAQKDARWRQAAPTDLQLARLRKEGVPETVLQGLTRGKASAMIERLAQGFGPMGGL